MVSRYELALDEPMDRGLTSVNVRPDDKAVFDQLQGYWSAKKGRRLRQWEVFTLVLADALERRRSDLELLGRK